ncbi:MAG: hypothetical protein WCD04_07895 [Terriglobia bacterium]
MNRRPQTSVTRQNQSPTSEFGINDPVRFQKSIRVTVEHGHANNFRNDYTLTAFRNLVAVLLLMRRAAILQGGCSSAFQGRGITMKRSLQCGAREPCGAKLGA